MPTELQESQLFDAALLGLPHHAVRDFISVGVCVRCIFRFFGVHGRVYASPLLSYSRLQLFLEEPGAGQGAGGRCDTPHGSEGDPVCRVCLGILQFIQNQDEQVHDFVERQASLTRFVSSIVDLVKREGHVVDGFSLEVSLPAVISENEQAMRLYMEKYESEDWFQMKLIKQYLSVKDCLILSVKDSLEKLLGVESGVSSFRICLTYSHPMDSLKQQTAVKKDNGFKRKKTGTELPGDFNNGAGILRACDNHLSESSSDSLAFQEKVLVPCHLQSHCYQTPIYIGGRYLKFSRNVSQTCWIIDDERMGEASVEEIVCSNILIVCRGDNYKFHSAGREDIDVRMLGAGRPFLVEIVNPRHLPSTSDFREIEDKINNLEAKLVGVRKLQLVGTEAWTLMREGEAEKQKQYAALVWISRLIKDEDVQNVSSMKDMDILQRTPIRVLHRRSPLERKRIIHWMKIERIAGNSQYFFLHLCTQAGTYIKEFVHGDLGRTHPSIGSILGCRAEIVQLDVTDVKLDCFN